MLYIHSLALYDWRNYQEQIFHFEASSVVFYGHNGAGKTNLLEAIALLSVGKSWRTTKNAHLIGDRSESTKIELLTNQDDRYSLLLEPTKKQFFKNDKKETFKNHLGQIPTLLFAPEQLTLFSGSASNRRSLFDRLLCQMSHEYQASLSRYEKARKQRTALFKDETVPTEDLLPWEHIMSEEMPFLHHTRQKLVQDIQPFLQKSFEAISGGTETITLTLESIDEEVLSSPENVRSHFETIRFRETAAQRCLFGPHKDDWIFTLRHKPITATASRGEERSVLLALLDAQKQILEQYLDQKPILLLDDVFSELDSDRQAHLVALCQDTQVFFTTTHKEHFAALKDVQAIEIE